jgi:hypothetical protein
VTLLNAAALIDKVVDMGNENKTSFIDGYWYVNDVKTLWVVDSVFVMEPLLGGQLLGELPGFDAAGYQFVHYSQEEFDQMAEAFKAEFGHYPDS